ncbi:MAG TPA: hypothetical protein GX693_07525 [Firmicutes bacterium]|nr:hypothetical protein [Bacillota bacterium]
MHRFLVIESRRLLPLLFLLVLLVSLSIYDNFFKADRAVITPVEDLENALTFVTAGKGEVAAETSFQVIETLEQWQDLQEQYSVLPDYPFNVNYEFAVSAVHGEIKNIRIFPQEEGLVQVRVQVSPLPQSYHVVTVERDKVGAKSVWQFVDLQDQVLSELTIPAVAGPEAEETE